MSRGSSDGAGGRDLLVASAGGHLTQLKMIADRFADRRPRTFVTYDHPQSRSLLADEDVVYGSGPSSRSASALVRNWVLARELLASGGFDRVVSTGSAIAVPFLLEAARHGLVAHYLESATRSDGPSMTGRILQRTSRRVTLHTQHGRWATARWHEMPSVFDGFQVVEGPGAERPLRVVVSLGTHRFPFTRLLHGLASALTDEDSVLLQHGATAPVGLPGRVEVVHSLPAERLDAEVAACDVVVAHAGTGIALISMLAGHCPVLLPRRVDRGEHVDDHQAGTAASLDARGLVVATTPEELTRDHLLLAASRRVDHVGSDGGIHLAAPTT